MKTTTSWGLVLSALVFVSCTNGAGPTLARPNTRSQHQALGQTNLQASAQFDAPVIDASTGGPQSTGAGSFQVAPSLSGGNGSLGVIDGSSSYVMIGDLNGSPANFFAIVADVPFTTGTHTIDNVHWFAGVFDAASGEPTHLASAGTVTLTSVGTRWVGSFSGTVDEVATVPSCRSSADCASGESCINGTCVVTPPPTCTSCSPGQQCVNGMCVSVPACAVDTDCARGQQCISGQCIVVSTQCDGRQGAGSLSGNVTTVASCTALSASNVSLNAAAAVIDDQLRLMILEAAGAEGALIELAVCPGAVGTLSLGNGLVAASHVKQVETPELRLLAERKASAATLTVTQLSPQLAGSFSLTIASGGLVAGTFTLH